MHALAELLAQVFLELVTWIFPWGARHESRSIVGESDLDRRVRRFWILVFSLVVVIGAALWLWLHFSR